MNLAKWLKLGMWGGGGVHGFWVRKHIITTTYVKFVF